MKAGFNIPDWSRRGWNDKTNTAGTFYFSSLADYDAGRPHSFVQQVGDGDVVFVEKQVGGFVQDEVRIRMDRTHDRRRPQYDRQNHLDDSNNVGPRASCSRSRRRRAARRLCAAGAGLSSYDRTGPNPILDLLRFDGQRPLRTS